MTKIKQYLRLSLSSTNHRSLEKATEKIIAIVNESGGLVLGPMPLPNKRKLFSLLRSPHVYHSSQDAFELVYHKRVIMVYSSGGRQLGLQDLNEEISSDVDVQGRYMDTTKVQSKSLDGTVSSKLSSRHSSVSSADVQNKEKTR